MSKWIRSRRVGVTSDYVTTIREALERETPASHPVVLLGIGYD